MLKNISPNKTFLCVNNYYTGSGGDERTYARLAASHAGAPLVERNLSIKNARFDLINEITPSVIIDNYTYALFFAAEDHDLAVNNNMASLFSGLAGDVAFFGFCEELVAVDTLRKYGIGPKFWKTCYNISKLRKSTVYETAAKSIGMAFKKPFELEESPACPRPFLANLASEIQPEISPLGDDSLLLGLPHSKQLYIKHLYVDTIYYPPVRLPAFPKSVAPYFTQPVIEAGLAIPTYFLSNYGQNRGLIRDVFADLLPQEIRQRQAKGTTISFQRAIVRNNALLIQKYICEGLLSAADLINIEVMSDMLRNVDQQRMENISAIWDIFNLEIWAQAWARVGIQKIF